MNTKITEGKFSLSTYRLLNFEEATLENLSCSEGFRVANFGEATFENQKTGQVIIKIWKL